jgi:hypothetical protein
MNNYCTTSLFRNFDNKIRSYQEKRRKKHGKFLWRKRRGEETFLTHTHTVTLLGNPGKWVLVMMATKSSIKCHVPINQNSLRRQGLGSEQKTQAVPHRINQKKQKRKKKKKKRRNH